MMLISLGTLFYLSQGFDLPEKHIRAGLVTQTGHLRLAGADASE